MSEVVTVREPWSEAARDGALCRVLESGGILLLPDTPLDWTLADRRVLWGAELGAAHKNIAYRRAGDRLDGLARGGDAAAVRRLLRSYADGMTALLARLLPPYAARWRVDATSLRPREEAGRALPRRARNDLLHVDAFPSRPTNGDRILRAFTNLHPTQPRRWLTGEPFDHLVERLPAAALRPPRRGSPWQWLRRRLAGRAPAALAPLLRRSPYDVCMLRLHDRLKADARYQATAPRRLREFPPGSSWIVFSDAVPHGVLSGQCACEQTFFLPCAALLEPDRAPVAILERRCGRRLTDP